MGGQRNHSANDEERSLYRKHGTKQTLCDFIQNRQAPPLTTSDEWICVQGTHEPLVDMETWEAVQTRIKKECPPEDLPHK
ncbi:recombinase family protein [endosymbiont 'TC1' of Trimyema compressum]|uniref:recombinase family protein n=1 Tax=endosymbiont 'TC1' of Trimyema compressum TaxID=243899 RepID=UPI000B4DD50A